MVKARPGTRYHSAAQAPKSVSRHRSEQNGRQGFGSHGASPLHAGHRTLLAFNYSILCAPDGPTCLRRFPASIAVLQRQHLRSPHCDLRYACDAAFREAWRVRSQSASRIAAPSKSIDISWRESQHADRRSAIEIFHAKNSCPQKL